MGIFLIFMPESPAYLHYKGKFKQSRDVFKRISRINKIPFVEFKFIEEHIIEKKIGNPKNWENTSLLTLFKNKTSIFNLISMTLNWAVVSFSWYVVGFNVHYFKGNPYRNSFLLGFSDVAANILTRSFQYCSPTKFIFMGCFIEVFIISIIYLIFNSHYFMVPLCIILLRCGITIGFSLSYYGNSEFFPS